jgi:hypothetical protein
MTDDIQERFVVWDHGKKHVAFRRKRHQRRGLLETVRDRGFNAASVKIETGHAIAVVDEIWRHTAAHAAETNPSDLRSGVH